MKYNATSIIVVASLLISCHNSTSKDEDTKSVSSTGVSTEVSNNSCNEERTETTLKVSFEYDKNVNGYTVSGSFYPRGENAEKGKVEMDFVKNGEVAFRFLSDDYTCYSTTGGNIHWKDGEHYVFKYISPEVDNPYYSNTNPLGYHTSFQFYDLDFDGKQELLVSDYYRGHGGNQFYVYAIKDNSLHLIDYPPYNSINNDSEILPELREIVTYYEDGVWEQMKIVYHKGKPSKVHKKDTLQFSSDSWVAQKAIDAMVKTRNFYVKSVDYKIGDRVIKYRK